MAFKKVINKQLGELLIEQGIITQVQLERALLVQQEKGGLIGEILVSLNYAKEEDIAQALTVQYGFPFLPLSSYEITPEIIELVPFSVAKQYLVIPIDKVGNNLTVGMSNPLNIEKSVEDADLVVGAVLIPGARAPKLIREYMVRQMRPGSVLVDVAIDQGGSIETIDRVTTHENPYFIKYGVVHYSVANMPGAVPRTSTFALTNATLPYVLKLADAGAEKALRGNPALMRGLNVYKGALTCRAVADAQERPYTPAEAVLA